MLSLIYPGWGTTSSPLFFMFLRLLTGGDASASKSMVRSS
jgi:hypothetical protein